MMTLVADNKFDVYGKVSVGERAFLFRILNGLAWNLNSHLRSVRIRTLALFDVQKKAAINIP